MICVMELNYSQAKSVLFCMNRAFLVTACVDAMVCYMEQRDADILSRM